MFYRAKKKIAVALAACVAVAGIYCLSGKITPARLFSNLSAAVTGIVGKTATASVATSADVSDSGVQYYFPRDGQQPEPVLVNIMNRAKSTLDVAIYSITDTDIADAMLAAKRRGVAVRVLSDRECSENRSQAKVLAEFKNAGIPVKLNTHAGLMHLKVTIADKSVVTTGSFNYTKAAESQNDEVFVVLGSAKAAQDFDAQFERMWNDTADFADYE